ncbi:hypothetical protein [Sphingomonas crocodyli]|uniref:Uncharacterized protein n=1 Tax=Sphingomonas crocodyli TaxID=1979270 RepID=A0A437LXP4_9SPHN|nr:hypothetical protein [Sphingomonas crocodyli]RVT90126.1 hypothetical protein EOD43_17605 [Sphingomonas crocodyli]
MGGEITGCDGSAALLLVTALIVNLETRGGKVVGPIEKTVSDLLARTSDPSQRSALEIALDVVQGLKGQI